MICCCYSCTAVVADDCFYVVIVVAVVIVVGVGDDSPDVVAESDMDSVTIRPLPLIASIDSAATLQLKGKDENNK